ncbi:high mobility group protein 20A isoform X4 [Cygnus atratus]|uniref:high mobility group protein 20A isoform X4 n=1 Tax=Cygnus atratus TaxID=8868 RepID=UPI0021B6FCFD|nr:high mobility group protein 20A isoform X4 [Cygnus atratus]XP_050569059.1 high mobility group protein 20A isoform X4 [Cygnus atratus]XP_050569060.1 high mobility group protein 20A isoform X4 [Cygnus atratus]XP_050569061.1 high mobility group protein 20A isoform X4 [Cygnus atratus]
MKKKRKEKSSSQSIEDLKKKKTAALKKDNWSQLKSSSRLPVLIAVQEHRDPPPPLCRLLIHRVSYCQSWQQSSSRDFCTSYVAGHSLLGCARLGIVLCRAEALLQPGPASPPLLGQCRSEIEWDLHLGRGREHLPAACNADLPTPSTRAERREVTPRTRHHGDGHPGASTGAGGTMAASASSLLQPRARSPLAWAAWMCVHLYMHVMKLNSLWGVPRGPGHCLLVLQGLRAELTTEVGVWGIGWKIQLVLSKSPHLVARWLGSTSEVTASEGGNGVLASDTELDRSRSQDFAFQLSIGNRVFFIISSFHKNP